MTPITDLIPAEVAAQSVAGMAADLASTIAHASYSNHCDCVYAKQAIKEIANIRQKLTMIEAALGVKPQPAPVVESPAHPDLDLAWARVNVLGGSCDVEGAYNRGYNEAISDVLSLLEKIGATTAVWDAGG